MLLEKLSHENNDMQQERLEQYVIKIGDYAFAI